MHRAAIPPADDDDHRDGNRGDQPESAQETPDIHAEELLVDRLWKLCQAELRIIASTLMRPERNRQTLQTTMLLHEAFVELRSSEGLQVKGQAHFSRLLRRVMKRILARRGKRRRLRRIAEATYARETTLASSAAEGDADLGVEFVAILAEWNLRGEKWIRRAEVVETHFFLGLDQMEVAELLGVSDRTVRRDVALIEGRLRASRRRARDNGVR